jgi:hypothetical protein
MVNHPNRSIPKIEIEYSPEDAVRLTLMAWKALASLSKEPSFSINQVAEEAMRQTYGTEPPYDGDQGVFAHVWLFSSLVLAVACDPADERLAGPLPGEDALFHAKRLEDLSKQCREKAEALKA